MKGLQQDQQLYLVDLLDRLLDKGVVVRGHITISVADIDLLYLDVSILLSSVERALRSVREPTALACAPRRLN